MAMPRKAIKVLEPFFVRYGLGLDQKRKRPGVSPPGRSGAMLAAQAMAKLTMGTHFVELPVAFGRTAAMRTSMRSYAMTA